MCSSDLWWQEDDLPLLISFAEGSEPSIPGEMSVYFINPNSASKELAMDFLEFTTKSMNRVRSISLYPDDNEPVENSYYQQNLDMMQQGIERLEKQIAEAADDEIRMLEEQLSMEKEWLAQGERWRWEVSPEQIASYREQLPYVQFGNDYDMLFRQEQVSTLYQRFLAKQIGIDQFINECDRVLRMMRMEQ